MMGRRDHILVIKLGALGDMVQAFGPMDAIRRHHPNARLTLLTTAPFVDLARQFGRFNDIWTDTRPRWHQPNQWLALKKKLDGGQFTRVYDLQNNDRTALYFKLMTPKPEWVGAAPGASHVNTDPTRTAGHAFEGHKQTLALAGITDIALDTLDWLEGDIDRFDLTLPCALIVPGASRSRPLKRWPAHHYGALCARLQETGVRPVLIGGVEEKETARKIKNTCPDAIDLTGQTTMADLPALARKAAFAIGNDTGPMHFIAQAGCASLVLFSSDSDPRRHRPLGKKVETLQKDDLEDLSVDDVLAALNAHHFLDYEE